MTGPTPEEQSSDSAQLHDAELDQIAGGEDDPIQNMTEDELAAYLGYS